LPNGLEYHFFYTEYGELARIEMPTGGVIETENRGQACDFAILTSQEFPRLDLARDITANTGGE
jgi:hypothetical protein